MCDQTQSVFSRLYSPEGFYLSRCSIDGSFLSLHERVSRCKIKPKNHRDIVWPRALNTAPCLRANSRTRVPNVTNCGYPAERHTCSLVCPPRLRSRDRLRLYYMHQSNCQNRCFIDHRPSQLSSTLNRERTHQGTNVDVKCFFCS